MNQMIHLISLKKMENIENDKKVYPTLNFLCPKTLKSWENLRKISLDYGS